jgi:hypothetical protein
MFRRLALVLGMLLVAACARDASVDDAPSDMGNFRLGHTAVVVNQPEKGPFSRKATDAELKDALETALQDRFGAYAGDEFYHIGVKLDLFALAMPGVPVVMAPRSVFIVSVSFWQDSTQTRLSEEGGKGLTVYEGPTFEAVVSSGLFRTKKAQMRILADNTAKAIQDWILENPDWIGLTSAPTDVPDDN